MAPLVGQKLQSILASIDPSYSLEPEAEEHLLRMADDFLDNVVKRGMRLAKHRGSDRLDVQDLSLVLRKGWGITVPGLGSGGTSFGSRGGSGLAGARTLSSGSGSGGGAGSKAGGAGSKAGGTKRKAGSPDGAKATKKVAGSGSKTTATS